jgi:hypothetical protein
MDVYVGEAALEANTWYHITVTYTPELLKCYLNGELINEVVPNSPLSGNTKDLAIGRDTPQSTDYFHGILDEINIYNRTLSDAEVMALKNFDGCDAASVGEKKLPKSFDILPNPASGQVQFKLPDSDRYELSVMDLQGRVLSRLEAQQHSVKMDISEFDRGMYLVKICSEKGYAVEKLIVR